MKKNFRFLGVLLVIALLFTTVLGTGLVAFAAPFTDELVSGHYYMGADAYDASLMMKMPMYFVIDADADTFDIYPYSGGKADMSTSKGSGTISYDMATGVHTLTYSDDATKMVTMTATADKLTFTSKVYYGTAFMDQTDINGDFIPYSADKVMEDMLMSGNYLISADAYDASAVMKLETYIVIDRSLDTFSIYPYSGGMANISTIKGSGSIAYDMNTGIYTLAYTAGIGGAGAGVTSTITATKDSLTYVTPMYYGAIPMNTVDAGGTFIPYTAKLVTDSSAADVELNTGSTIEGTVAKSTISDYTIENASKAAINAAQTSGTAPKVTINVETDAAADTLEVTLRTIELAALLAEDGAMFEIASDVGSITFDKAAIEKLAMYSDVPVTFSVGEAKSLTEEQKAIAGDDTVFTLTAMAGSEYITNFDGSVTVTVPYTLKDGESAADVTVYHLDSEGKLTKLSATYANGMVTFTTTHFSEFLIRAVGTDTDADSDIPDTSSDNTMNVVFMVLAGLSVISMGLAISKRKRNSTNAK